MSAKARRSRSATSISKRPRRRRRRSAPSAYAVHLDVTDLASIEAAVKAVEDKDRRARHPGQQRRAVRPRADRRDHQRELRQAVLGQCRGHAVHAAGGRPLDDRARQGRQDHQHGEPGRPARRGAGRGLLRHQGRRHHAHPVGRARPDQARHQRQRHRARRGRRRALGSRRCAVCQIREPAAGEKKRLVGEAVPYGRMGTAAGSDRHGGVPGQRRRATTSSPRPTMSTAATG